MAMALKSVWKLKRFGRFLPGTQADGGKSWKVVESGGSSGELVLTIVASGHMLVSQGQELLDGLSLLDAPSFLKIQQKSSDTLVFRITVKGESRLLRMQFGGSSRAEVLEECSSAVIRLKEYLPVSTEGDQKQPLSCPPPPTQPPRDTNAQDQQTLAGEGVRPEPEVVQGSLSVKRLTQHFLGEQGVSLPLVYRQCDLPHGELEPFLRLCLLDPSFPAFVEEVQGALETLLQD